MTTTTFDVPPQVTYGQIVGHFVRFLADSPDPGNVPDELPLTGTITLTPITRFVRFASTLPPRLAAAEDLLCPVLDADLYPPGTTTAGDVAPGLFVIATDQPAGQPTTVQWRATFRFDDLPVQPNAVIFDVPAGGVVDLSIVAPVAPDVPTVQVLTTFDASVAEQANQSAQAAAQAAQDAQDAADQADVTMQSAVRWDGPQTLTAPQQTQGRNNIVAVGRGELVLRPQDFRNTSDPDDTASINAAIAAANNAGGGTVECRGVFNVAPPLIMLDRVTLRAGDRGGVLQRTVNDGNSLISANGKTGFKIQGLQLAGTASAQVANGYGIHIVGCTDAAVEGVKVSGQPFDGIGIDTTPSQRVRVRDFEVTACYGKGCQFTGQQSDHLIENGWVHDNLGAYAYVLGYASGGQPSKRCTLRNLRSSAGGFSGGFQLNWLTASLVDGLFSENDVSAHVLLDLTDNDVYDLRSTGATPVAAFIGATVLDRCTNVRLFGGRSIGALGTYGAGLHMNAGCQRVRSFGWLADSNALDGIRDEGTDTLIDGWTSRNNTQRGIRVIAATRPHIQRGRAEGNTLAGIQLETTTNDGRVWDNEVTNYAAAGANPPMISIASTVTNSRIWRNDIHDSGASTRISGTGGAGCVVRDDKSVKATVGSAATDPASTMALANQLRQALLDLGLA